MLTAFVIAFREGLEIFLVIIPLIVFFNKSKLYDMSKSILSGGLLGFVLSTIVGGTIFSLTASLESQAGILFDGIIGLVLAGLVLYSVVLFRKSKIFDVSANKEYTELSIKGLFILSSITVFRELLEIVLFILGSTSLSPFIISAFILLGLLAAASAIYIASKGLSFINIKVIFYILNIFMVLLGAYYFGDGLSVLFENIVPQIGLAGMLLYAIPSLIIFLKNDLKQLLKSQLKK